MKNSTNTIEQDVITYLEHLEVIKRSKSTIDLNAYYLGFFCEWAEKRGLVRTEEVTLKCLKGFQKYLARYKKRNGENIVDETQHSMLGAIRKFFTRLNQQGELSTNPAEWLELPKIQHNKLPRKGFTPEEMEKIFAAPDVNTKLGLRNRAILAVLYSTGIRRAELVGIDVKDIDLEAKEMGVTDGKGGIERMAILGDSAIHWLKLYLEHSRPELERGKDDGALFLNKNGTRISIQGMTKLANRLIENAEIKKKGATHLFRHTFCTTLVLSGCHLRHAQELMGHQSIQYIARYSQLDLKDLKKAHAEHHPAA